MSRSERWRINKSAIPVVEMANALRALSKVAGAKGISKELDVKLSSVGSNVNFDTNTVQIKVADKLETCPIDPVAFDCMVGDTLHEAGHIVIDTKSVDRISRSWEESYGVNSKLVHLYVNIAEDILVDTTLFNDPVTAEYSRASLDWYKARRPRGPNPYNLLEMWIEIALYRNGQALLDLPVELGAAMNKLVELTRHIQHQRMYPQQRVAEYQRVWEEIKMVVLDPPKPPTPEPPVQPNVPQKEQEDGEDKDDTKSGEGESQKPDGQGDEESKEGDEPETDDPESGGDEEGESGGDESGKDDSGSGDDTDKDSPEGEDGETDTPDASDNGEDEEGEGLDGEGESDGDSEGDSDDSGDSSKSKGKGQKSDKFDRPHDMGEPVDASFAEEVDSAIVHETEDITDQVNDMLEEMGFSNISLPVLRDRQKNTPFVQPDPILVRQLETLVNVKKHLQNRTLRGERSGKIDHRHLSRVHTNGQIFKQTWKFPLGLPKTDILLDMSGSMTERQVHDVLQAAGAMTSLFRSRVWGYRHANSGIQLTRLDEEQRTRMMAGEGGTPSGLAILALLQTCQKDGLIIHLTDGEHNTGISPNQVQKMLQARKVEVVHVIWGRRPSGYSGIPHLKINGIHEFPEALRTLLTAGLKLEF